MILCYLGLGSNLRCPQRNLHQAINRLRKTNRISLLCASSFYFNKAQGRRAQPPFYNCVIKIGTTQNPQQLLKTCLLIEKECLRQRKVRWGARTLDIDILLYGKNRNIKQHNLIIPHPRMHERDFVIIPLNSIL